VGAREPTISTSSIWPRTGTGRNLLRSGTGRKPAGTDNTVVINLLDGTQDRQNFGNAPKPIREFFEYSLPNVHLS
jgi:hypothetical protein